MNRLLYTVLLVLSAAYAFSQAPGYMGKRFVLGYGLYANPRLLESGGSRGVNLRHDAYLEFAMKKNISVGVSAGFYNAMYTNASDVDTYVYDPSGIRWIQKDDSPNGFTNIKGRNYSVYFKFYKRNYLASWGKYFVLGPVMHSYKTTYDPDVMYVTLASSTYSNATYLYYNNFGPTTQSFNRFDLMFGNGRNRVIANRITLDYGYTMNVIGMTMALFDAVGESLVYSGPAKASEYIEATSAARVRSVNKFNLFLKVGYLF